MSHNGSKLIPKRKYNAIRPVFGGGFVPPAGFTIYTAFNGFPAPPKTVVAPPLTKRMEYLQNYSIVDAPETFEGKANGSLLDSQVITANGNNATLSTVEGATAIVTNSVAAGRFNTTPAGAKYARFAPDQVSGFTLTMFMGTPIRAFGLYFTDLGDFGAQYTVKIYPTIGVPRAYNVPYTILEASGNLIFWGFVDRSALYNQIDIYSNGGGGTDIGGFDDVTMAVAAQLVV